MTVRFRQLIALALAVPLAGAGCAAQVLPAQTASGAVVRQLMAAQTRPPAPQPAPAGLDGVAARAAVQRYEQSFQSGPASVEPLIGEGRAK